MPSRPSWYIMRSRAMPTYQSSARVPALRRFCLTAANKILIAAAGVVFLSWFVFLLLLSVWHLTDPSQGGNKLWSAGSVVIFAAAAIYVTHELLRLTLSGARPLLQSGRNGGGSSPGALLSGAPCPVPVRPTPHLVRSAAKRLPFEKRKPVDAISRDTK